MLHLTSHDGAQSIVDLLVDRQRLTRFNCHGERIAYRSIQSPLQWTLCAPNAKIEEAIIEKNDGVLTIVDFVNDRATLRCKIAWLRLGQSLDSETLRVIRSIDEQLCAPIFLVRRRDWRHPGERHNQPSRLGYLG